MREDNYFYFTSHLSAQRYRPWVFSGRLPPVVLPVAVAVSWGGGEHVLDVEVPGRLHRNVLSRLLLRPRIVTQSPA